MFYNDKETQESEKKFQEDIKMVREYAIKSQEEQGNLIFELIEEGNKLKEIEYPSEYEVARLKEIIEKIEEMAAVFKKNLMILEESLSRSSNYIYQEIKKQAAEGNPEAMKVYLELKPEYENIMLSKSSAN